ncbi:nucleotide exchange factor GrpE [Clostridium sp. 19966]|uniref:nucleotide exchange factor GrpE n=1 Tax=Clostridium sp. 19966 TaxID=2768166 RepID=UPI0028DE333F|nr:nucleotide exchange factor GrpE [Clostridium sp. 19966]MDT8715307.1 nucleotide exchange factor GrpE [Clostridium sp. 19966]
MAEKDKMDDTLESKEELIQENETDTSKEENEKDAEVLEDIEFEKNNEEDEAEALEKQLAQLKEDNSKLKSDLFKATNEFEALKDRLLRTNAEYDNFRKRTAKEKEEIYNDACAEVIAAVLPVLDSLERAATVESSLEDLKKGIEMTVRQFNNAFEKLKVEEIPSEGEFDPNLHNAVMHIEDENFGKNSIAEVFQKGYKKDEKIIRYSMVKVAN